MFDRGINNPEFVEALKTWNHWDEIVRDKELFIAIRTEYVSIYYQGCSLLKIEYKNGKLFSETHYKYLIRPIWKNPYVSWKEDSPNIQGRLDKLTIDKFDIDSLKKSSSWYAEAEKEGVHKILKSNGNIVDVEIALSSEPEAEADSAERSTKNRPAPDRIDFAAIRTNGGKPCIVFFEAKRFDNGDLKARNGEPRVFDQIKRYETFIRNNQLRIEESYRAVCRNLVDLAPDRQDPLVKAVAASPGLLTVDSEVRLVVFGYDRDEDKGEVWNKHKMTLSGRLGGRLLMRGDARNFTKGISEEFMESAA